MYRIPKAGMREQQIFHMKSQQHHCDFMIFRALGLGQFLTKQDLWHIETSRLKLPVRGFTIYDPEYYWSFVKSPWQRINGRTKGHLTSKESNPETEYQWLRALRTSGWWEILPCLQEEVPSNDLQVLAINSSPGGNKHRSATSADLYSSAHVNGHQAYDIAQAVWALRQGMSGDRRYSLRPNAMLHALQWCHQHQRSCADVHQWGYLAQAWRNVWKWRTRGNLTC